MSFLLVRQFVLNGVLSPPAARSTSDDSQDDGVWKHATGRVQSISQARFRTPGDRAPQRGV